jgi:hypothetical protein
MQNSVIPMIREKFGYADILEKNYFLVANSLTANVFHAPLKIKTPTSALHSLQWHNFSISKNCLSANFTATTNGI